MALSTLAMTVALSQFQVDCGGVLALDFRSCRARRAEGDGQALTAEF